MEKLLLFGGGDTAWDTLQGSALLESEVDSGYRLQGLAPEGSQLDVTKAGSWVSLQTLKITLVTLTLMSSVLKGEKTG